MNDSKQSVSLHPRTPSTPRIVPLVILLVLLFGSMILVGISLGDLLGLVDRNAT
jgi:hypothetical protein